MCCAGANLKLHATEKAVLPDFLVRSWGREDGLPSANVQAIARTPDHLDLFVIAECTGDHTYDKYIRPQHAAWAGLQYLLFRKGQQTPAVRPSRSQKS